MRREEPAKQRTAVNLYTETLNETTTVSKRFYFLVTCVENIKYILFESKPYKRHTLAKRGLYTLACTHMESAPAGVSKVLLGEPS